MYQQLVETKLNTTSRTKPVETPNNNISAEEAKKLLFKQFKDLVSVTKAMQMLGNKSTVSPKVSLTQRFKEIKEIYRLSFIGLQKTYVGHSKVDLRGESQSSFKSGRTARIQQYSTRKAIGCSQHGSYARSRLHVHVKFDARQELVHRKQQKSVVWLAGSAYCKELRKSRARKNPIRVEAVPQVRHEQSYTKQQKYWLRQQQWLLSQIKHLRTTA